MSQDQITSSEEYSDFNNDKLHAVESVPTSPEGSSSSSVERSLTPCSTSTTTTSVNDSKPDLKKETTSSLNISDHQSSSISTLIPNLSEDISTPDVNGEQIQTSTKYKKEKDEKKEKKGKKEKKEKKTPRLINFASGVSTSVPLTGERPMPLNHASMDDSVLLSIFKILYENDPTSDGMTVKQICDILVKKHPEISNLSSKTSNLVSAKLNAYVKKVEKGDKTIYYALSRDWADTSPKRMVYVYRGILSDEYPAYVQTMIEKHRAEEAKNNLNPANSVDDDIEMSDSNRNGSFIGNEKITSNANTHSPMSHDLSTLHSISPSGLQLNKVSPFGNGTMDFEIPQLSVPYSAAPVTASLNIIPLKCSDVNMDIRKSGPKSDFSIKKKNEYLTVIPDSDDENDVYNSMRSDLGEDDADDDIDNDEISIYENHGYYRRGSDIITERIPSSLGKRSKSISFMNKRTKSHSLSNMESGRQFSEGDSLQPKKIITAAALTPRVPRKQSNINTPNAAAAVAALRAVTLSTFTGSTADSVNSITNSIMNDTSVEPSISIKWLETVRSGFLNQDIESPENVSLAELDTLFT